MEDEIVQRIYKLTNELASQQQSNQELASDLTGQLSELKVSISSSVFHFNLILF